MGGCQKKFTIISPRYQIVRCHYLCLPFIDSTERKVFFAERTNANEKKNFLLVCEKWKSKEKVSPNIARIFVAVPHSLSTNSPSSINQFMYLMKRQEAIDDRLFLYFICFHVVLLCSVYLYALSHTLYLSAVISVSSFK